MVRIIVCEAEGQPENDVITALEVFNNSIRSAGVVKVPASPPLTRDQYNTAVQFWPVNFHENKV